VMLISPKIPLSLMLGSAIGFSRGLTS